MNRDRRAVTDWMVEGTRMEALEFGMTQTHEAITQSREDVEAIREGMQEDLTASRESMQKELERHREMIEQSIACLICCPRSLNSGCR